MNVFLNQGQPDEEHGEPEIQNPEFKDAALVGEEVHDQRNEADGKEEGHVVIGVPEEIPVVDEHEYRERQCDDA